MVRSRREVLRARARSVQPSNGENVTDESSTPETPRFFTRQELLIDNRKLVASRLRSQAIKADQQAQTLRNKRSIKNARKVTSRSNAAAAEIEKGTGPLTDRERISILKARFPDKKNSEIKRKALPFGSARRTKVVKGQQRKVLTEKAKEAEGFQGSNQEFIVKEKDRVRAENKAIAQNQRERFLASGLSRQTQTASAGVPLRSRAGFPSARETPSQFAAFQNPTSAGITTLTTPPGGRGVPTLTSSLVGNIVNDGQRKEDTRIRFEQKAVKLVAREEGIETRSEQFKDVFTASRDFEIKEGDGTIKRVGKTIVNFGAGAGLGLVENVDRTALAVQKGVFRLQLESASERGLLDPTLENERLLARQQGRESFKRQFTTAEGITSTVLATGFITSAIKAPTPGTGGVRLGKPAGTIDFSSTTFAGETTSVLKFKQPLLGPVNRLFGREATTTVKVKPSGTITETSVVPSGLVIKTTQQVGRTTAQQRVLSSGRIKSSRNVPRGSTAAEANLELAAVQTFKAEPGLKKIGVIEEPATVSSPVTIFSKQQGFVKDVTGRGAVTESKVLTSGEGFIVQSTKRNQPIIGNIRFGNKKFAGVLREESTSLSTTTVGKATITKGEFIEGAGLREVPVIRDIRTKGVKLGSGGKGKQELVFTMESETSGLFGKVEIPAPRTTIIESSTLKGELLPAGTIKTPLFPGFRKGVSVPRSPGRSRAGSFRGVRGRQSLELDNLRRSPGRPSPSSIGKTKPSNIGPSLRIPKPSVSPFRSSSFGFGFSTPGKISPGILGSALVSSTSFAPGKSKSKTENIADTKTGERFKFDINAKVKPDEKLKQEPAEDSSFFRRGRTDLITEETPRTARPRTPFNIRPITPGLGRPRTPGGGFATIKFPGLKGKKKSKKSKKADQEKAFTPSAFALGLGIRGKKPGRLAIKTGLGIRPIIGDGKRSRFSL